MWTPGGRRKAAAIFAPEIGTLSPSVITTISRRRDGRREVAVADDRLERLEPRRRRDERALRRRPVDPDRAQQRRAKTSSSSLGKRCGSTRSVNDAIPTGTSPRRRGSGAPRRGRARTGSGARARAREHRAGRVDDDERLRVRRGPRGRRSTRAAAAPPRARAARPRRPAPRRGARARGRRLRQPDRPAHRLAARWTRRERDERHDDAEREQRAERRQQRDVHPSSRCRARRRPRRASRGRRRRVLARGGLGREEPRAPLEHHLEVVLRVVVLGIELDRLLEARDRVQQQLGAVLLLRPACGVEFQATMLSTPSRFDAASGAPGRGRGPRSTRAARPRRSAGSRASDPRRWRRGACSAAARGACAGRRGRPRSRAGAPRRRTARARAGCQSSGGAQARDSGRRRPESPRQRATSTATSARTTATTTQAAAHDEQQLPRQVRQPAPHAAALRAPGRQREPAGVALVGGERDEEQRAEQEQRRGSGRRLASGGSGSRTGPSASGVNAPWPRIPPKSARVSLDGPSASRWTGLPARLI